jgi:hypothetical protein
VHTVRQLRARYMTDEPMNQELEEIKRCVNVVMNCAVRQFGDFPNITVITALIRAAYTLWVSASHSGPAGFAAFLEAKAADFRNGKIVFYRPDKPV